MFLSQLQKTMYCFVRRTKAGDRWRCGKSGATDTADPENETQGWSRFSTDQQDLGGSSLPGSWGTVANRTVTVTDRVPIFREPQGAGRGQDRRDEQMPHIAKKQERADSRSCRARRLASHTKLNPCEPREKKEHMGGPQDTAWTHRAHSYQRQLISLPGRKRLRDCVSGFQPNI